MRKKHSYKICKPMAVKKKKAVARTQPKRKTTVVGQLHKAETRVKELAKKRMGELMVKRSLEKSVRIKRKLSKEIAVLRKKIK